MRYHFYAVIVTRPDWTEEVIALICCQKRAEALVKQLALMDRIRQEHIRYRFKPVVYTLRQIAAVMERWGEQDAKRGLTPGDSALLPEPYRNYYLRGYYAGV